MNVKRALPLIVSVALLNGCAARVVPPARPPARPDVKPAPLPAPTPSATVRPAAQGWRDQPYTPGVWAYAPEGNGSAARFGPAGGAPLLILRCDRQRSAVVLARAGAATVPVPATITTSSETRPLTARPVTGFAALEIVLAQGDRLLDAMAFSRGRFLVEVNGLPTLVLPAWSEVGRVIEDCR